MYAVGYFKVRASITAMRIADTFADAIACLSDVLFFTAQSPNPNYNPNASMIGNWTELVPIHH